MPSRRGAVFCGLLFVICTEPASAVLQTGVATAAQNLVTIGGERFCSQGFAPAGMVRVSAWQLDAQYDFQLARENGTPCLRYSSMCRENESPLFNLKQGDNEHFSCLCDGGYYRHPETLACIECSPSQVCPQYSDDFFRCPPDSEAVAQREPAVPEDGLEFCAPHSGFNLQSRQLEHRYRLFDARGSSLYSTVAEHSCSYLEEEAAAGECVCRPGYFLQEGVCVPCNKGSFCRQGLATPCPAETTSARFSADASDCSTRTCLRGFFLSDSRECMPCPVGFYCAQGKITACPQNSTTHAMYSGSEEACVCAQGLLRKSATHVQGGFVCSRDPKQQLMAGSRFNITELPVGAELQMVQASADFAGAAVVLDRLKGRLSVFLVNGPNATVATHIPLDTVASPSARQKCRLGAAVWREDSVVCMLSCAYGDIMGIVTTSVRVARGGTVTATVLKTTEVPLPEEEAVALVDTVPALVEVRTERVGSPNLHTFRAPSLVLNLTDSLTALGYVMEQVSGEPAFVKHASPPFSATDYLVHCVDAGGNKTSNTVHAPDFDTPRLKVFRDDGVFCLDTPVQRNVLTVQITATTSEVLIPKDRNVSISWLDMQPLQFDSGSGVAQTMHGIDQLSLACTSVSSAVGNHMEEARALIQGPGANASELQSIFAFVGAKNTTTGGVLSATAVFEAWDADADGRVSPRELAQTQSVAVGAFLEECAMRATQQARAAQTEISAAAVEDSHLQALGHAYNNVSFRVVDTLGPYTTRSCFHAFDCSPADVATRLAVEPALRPASWLLRVSGPYVFAQNHSVQPCPENAVAADDLLSCQCTAGFKTEPGSGLCSPCGRAEKCDGAGRTQTCNILSDEIETQRCACLQGTYLKDGNCMPCPQDHSCSAGVALLCAANTTAHSDPRKGCVCKPGLTLSPESLACEPCRPGFWCRDAKVHACPLHQTSGPGAGREDECTCQPGFTAKIGGGCTPCPSGSFMPVGSSACQACGPNMTTHGPGAVGAGSCVCEDGFRAEGAACVPCQNRLSACSGGVEHACAAGQESSVDHSHCVCASGFFRTAAGEPCTLCVAGFFCNERQQLQLQQCPPSMTSEPGAASPSDCFCRSSEEVEVVSGLSRACTCAPGFSRVAGACVPCPRDSARLLLPGNLTGNSDACLCSPGFFAATQPDGQAQCEVCRPGFFCPGSRFEQGRIPCPAGTFSQLSGMDSSLWCLPCPMGGGYKVAGRGSLEECADEFMPFIIESNTSYLLSGASPLASFHVTAAARNVSEATLPRIEDLVAQGIGLHAAPRFLGFSDADDQVALKWEIGDDMLTRLSALVARQTSGPVYESVYRSLLAAPHSANVILGLAFCMIMNSVTADVASSPGMCVLFKTLSEQSTALAAAAARVIAEGIVGGSAAVDIVVSFDQQTSNLVGMLQDSSRVGQYAELAQVADVVDIVAFAPNSFAAIPVSAQGRSVLRTIDRNNQKRYPVLRFAAVEKILTNIDANICSQNFAFAHECSAAAASGSSVCSLCTPGVEFRNSSSGLCQPCRDLTAEGCEAVEGCCGFEDARCAGTSKNAPSSRDLTLCGNGVIDILAGEQCDWNDKNTHCCDMTCMLLPGYYAFPWCSTVCGDDIVAGSEVCDSLADAGCSRETCQCYPGFKVGENGRCS